MKKLISALVIVLLVFASVTLTGCNEDDTYWQEVYEQVVEFKETETNAFLITSSDSYEITVDYSVAEGETSTVLIPLNESNLDYYHLETIYGKILENLLVMFNKYSSTLEVKPVLLNKQTKAVYDEFSQELINFQTAINTFEQKKQEFLTSVKSDFDSSRSISLLKNFKKDYANFIYSARDFNKDFENLYTTTYKSIPSEIGQTPDNGLERLAGYITINRLTSVYLSYYFDDFEKATPTTGINFSLLTSLDTLRQSIDTGTLKEDRVELLTTWLNNYKLFDREVEIFSIALQNIDLNDFVVNYNADQTAFLAQNPTLEVYFDTINNFIGNISNVILTSTLTLF